MTMTAEQIARGLTKAQREAILSASFTSGSGPWHLQGWYVNADKRVRYALALCNVTRNYLRASNALTPLGLAVRQILERQCDAK